MCLLWCTQLYKDRVGGSVLTSTIYIKSKRSEKRRLMTQRAASLPSCCCLLLQSPLYQALTEIPHVLEKGWQRFLRVHQPFSRKCFASIGDSSRGGSSRLFCLCLKNYRICKLYFAFCNISTPKPFNLLSFFTRNREQIRMTDGALKDLEEEKEKYLELPRRSEEMLLLRRGRRRATSSIPGGMHGN